jgi:hypothetical protein
MYKFLLIFIFVSTYWANSQDICRDYRIYDGAEPIINFGMDTTFNWWAITNPTNERYRLIINGEESGLFSNIKIPVFSYDGFSWATFAIDQGVTTLITRDTSIFIFAADPGEILFSSITNQLVYTYFKGSIEYAVMPNRTIEMMNKEGKFFINQNCTRFAYVAKRGLSYSININGRESTIYEKIIPVGFDVENKFIYAAFLGNGWQIYADNKNISDIFPDIYEAVINREGTCYAFAVRSFSTRQQVMLFSHDYYEPLISQQYESVGNIVLHPYLALVGYSASFQNIRYVAMNSAEYFGGIRPGPPKFTFDGEDFYFISCDLDCFMSLNGRRYNIKINLEPGDGVAVAPKSKTFAYTTGSSMMVYFVETSALHAGMMVDNISPPRYNRFDKRYESLGVIGSRLYLLTCTPPVRY